MFKYFASIIILFLVDRFSKIYILNLPTGRQEIHLKGGFFSLHINQDIAFSLPLSYFILYPLVILILLGLIFSWYKNFKKKSVLIWPLGLLIIGAVSNFLDRIQYGGVIDFINVPYFTVFNISDIYISIAVIWILWYSWFYHPKGDHPLGGKKRAIKQ
ncbi:signal peptidase II [bacterium]|nr:signal peptidase II [bacterium]